MSDYIEDVMIILGLAALCSGTFINFGLGWALMCGGFAMLGIALTAAKLDE